MERNGNYTKSVHFIQQAVGDQRNNFSLNNNAAVSDSSRGRNEYEAFANIFSTNLNDLMELSNDHKKDDETEEMISEAMGMPPEQRERRLKEIDQHVRFRKEQQTRQKILHEKNHRPFDDSNIGLCSVCMDENFQVVHPVSGGTACEQCFNKIQDKLRAHKINIE